ncbi:helix-turn-helix domain-containing protein [Tenacibaculum maritimum]|nr:helix-turn-helix domain-containing protein [Tenacibaculum maritimum]MDB0601603.1 helix-turn-helix domain-containing protein [Tenacibaculum maritimum]MDB0601618.1 helix-turn-helix domain-containing protein [Tenacibaculum maritimum]MDB0601673.1 helix-turn-helix domain-containing protein [Tenacibaculum maritimum]MDB0612860.1 helix-turn-helix domain-containing protein [Tenacibaculum maritimum]
MTERNYKKRIHIQEVIKLYHSGKTQEYIANKINVTPKTIGVWLKDVKQLSKDNLQLIKQLQQKLQESLLKGSRTKEINDLTQSIERLENRWFNK